jgi:flagellar FliL protein
MFYTSSSRYIILSYFICVSFVMTLPQLAWAGGGNAEPAKTYPLYLPMKSVIVNLDGKTRARFLRIELQLFVQNAEDEAMIEHHMPLLRDKLVVMLGGRSVESLEKPGAREALREEVREALREIMMLETGHEAIQELYFTGFIIQ